MALDFPTPASVGQKFTAQNGVVYTWDGQAWYINPVDLGSDYVLPPATNAALGGVFAGAQPATTQFVSGVGEDGRLVYTEAATLGVTGPQGPAGADGAPGAQGPAGPVANASMQPDANSPAIGVDGAGNLVYGPVGYAGTAGYANDAAHAANADNATNATNATNAGNADTVDGVHVGAGASQLIPLDGYGKIPFSADKVIISGGDPDGSGDQNWLWLKV